MIGGAAVYAETIAEAEELLLTQVLGDFHCTKFFPPYRAEFELEIGERRPTRRRRHLPIRNLATS